VSEESERPANATNRKSPLTGRVFPKRPMGTRTHDLRMASSTSEPDFQRGCGFLVRANPIGLHPITGDSGHELVRDRRLGGLPRPPAYEARHVGTLFRRPRSP